jgi:hypothetical protein
MIPRIGNTNNYAKPSTTYQQTLSNQDIKEKLKDYKKTDDIRKVSIGTHCRYFTVNPKTKEKEFRLGGNLNKIDPEGRYVILSNGKVNWSVQIPNTVFYQKMTETEYKNELKNEIKKQVMTEEMGQTEDENSSLKKQVKALMKKLEHFETLEQKYITAVNKNEELVDQLRKIENEIKKEKGKREKK